MTCILIDDDKDDAEIFKFILDELKLNIDFTSFASFDTAVSFMLNKEAPDLILLDGFMNTRTGEEGLKKLRAIPHLTRVPVIIYSGFIGDVSQPGRTGLGAHEVFIHAGPMAQVKEQIAKLLL